MRYSDLVEAQATETEIRTFLTEGELIAVTFRIPKNLKNAAMEASSLQGMSFSAFVRSCMIQELANKK